MLGAPPPNPSPPRPTGRNDFRGTYDPVKGDWLYGDDPYGPDGFMSPRKGGGLDPGTGHRVHTARALTPLSPCFHASHDPGERGCPPSVSLGCPRLVLSSHSALTLLPREP